jgi:hypothetical protein
VTSEVAVCFTISRFCSAPGSKTSDPLRRARRSRRPRRLVRALGECPLEHLNPVGGGDEYRVDVIAETIELVADLEQQGLLPGDPTLRSPVTRVEVFEDNHRGLVRLASSHAAATSWSASQ